MRAIGYYRCPGDAESLRLNNEAFEDYCDRNVHQPMVTFPQCENSESKNADGIQQVLSYVEDSGSSFLIVVPDAAHLGSDLEEVARSIVQLEASGCKVACADDDMPDPVQNAFDTLGVKGVSRKRSERIKESMRAKALNGKGLGRPPYGYRNGDVGTLVVVSEEVPVVELIYSLYVKEGFGLRLIAQRLNEQHIPTRRGGQWNMVTIRDILKNPTYMGTYTRFGLRIPKSHDPIIPPATFRKAQDETRTRRPSSRVSNVEPFLLSGLVYCGSCDNKMMGVTRRQTWRKKDGRRARGVYRYYQCQSRNNLSTCDYHTWKASLLEGTVLSQLRLVLANATSGHRKNGHADKRSATIWQERVTNAERRFLKAMRRIAKGEIKVDALGEYLTDLDNTRAVATSQEDGNKVAENISNWADLSFEQRHRLLNSCIAKIVVFDETVDLIV